MPTTTTIVASRTWAQAQSPFTSPAVAWPSTTRQAELKLASTTFTNPVNQVTFTIEESLDAGATWHLMAQAAFVGGTDRHGPITPGISVSLSDADLQASRQVRARMEVVGQIVGPLTLTQWTTAELG